MEFDLDRIQMNCFHLLLDTSLKQEETLEMIVPDASQDILRILETDGTAVLISKEAIDGRIEIKGIVKVHILYLPEGEDGIRHLDASIPFACTAEERAVNAACSIVAAVRLCHADTRAVNPRKVLIRAEVVTDIAAYTPTAEQTCSQVTEKPGLQIEQLIESREVYITACVLEKPISIHEEVPLPAGKSAAAELLKSRVELGAGEVKLIGNKLVYKGDVVLGLVYRGEDDSLCTARAELPFSQIMEIDGAEEDADCALTLVLTGANCCLTPAGDGKTITAEIDLLTQAVVRETRTIQLLTDAYSTSQPLSCEWESLTAGGKIDCGVCAQAVRESWDVPSALREIKECHGMIGQVLQSREGAQLIFTAQVEVCCLAVDEAGNSAAFHHPMTVTCGMDIPEGSTCLCQCAISGDIYSTPTANGIEVRFSLDFSYCCMDRQQLSAVSKLRANEEAQQAGEPPSLVLRMFEDGERLWDMAKTYGTTIADIIKANQLESESDAAGRLLLIPRKR